MVVRERALERGCLDLGAQRCCCKDQFPLLLHLLLRLLCPIPFWPHCCCCRQKHCLGLADGHRKPVPDDLRSSLVVVMAADTVAVVAPLSSE